MIFIDAIPVKIRDGQVANRPVYTVVGVTVDGMRDVIGLWVGDGGEGAKYWHQVLGEIRNRGVNDVLFLVCDGLPGLVESVNDIWPLAIVQTCVLHLVRNTFRSASKQYWYELARDLRSVYTGLDGAGREGALRRVRRQVGRALPGDHPPLDKRVGRVRALLGRRSERRAADAAGRLVRRGQGAGSERGSLPCRYSTVR